MMAGLPDIAGVYQGLFFGIETKMPDGGEPSAIQRLRHHEIQAAGGIVKVARSVTDALEVIARINTQVGG